MHMAYLGILFVAILISWVKSCNSHLVRGKWWHVDFKEMPTMWQYKELEGKEKQKEVLSL